jgi:large subunit ribosomal protein L25
MKTLKIKGSLRKNLGKKATKSLRNDDNVPCVLYGGGENVNFYAPSMVFKNLVYTPNSYLVKLDIDGTSHDAIMKEIQFHPVTDKINHIDFVRFQHEKPIIMNVPVHVKGNAIGVRKGGKLRVTMRYLIVKALAKDLPDFVELNVEDIEVGQSIKVGDVTIKNATIVSNPKLPIVDVRISRMTTPEEEKAEADAAAAAAAAAEGTAEGAAEVAAPAAK